MRKFGIASLLAAVVALGSSATAGELLVVDQPLVLADQPIGVQYLWEGPCGTLSIAGADGLPFAAFAVDGRLVASGVAAGASISLGVPNSGQLLDGTVLFVTVGDVLFKLDDEEWDWK